jgi:hypothetical protein
VTRTVSVNVSVLVVVEISFIKNVSFVVEFVISTMVERVALRLGLASALSCLILRGLGSVTTSVVTTVRSVYDVETSVMNWVNVGIGWRICQ